MFQITPSGERPIKWTDAIFILRFHFVFSGYISLEVSTKHVNYIVYNSDRFIMNKNIYFTITIIYLNNEKCNKPAQFLILTFFRASVSTNCV